MCHTASGTAQEGEEKGGKERGYGKEEEAFCHFTCDRREARDGNRTMEKNAMLLKRPSKTSNSD